MKKVVLLLALALIVTMLAGCTSGTSSISNSGEEESNVTSATSESSEDESGVSSATSESSESGLQDDRLEELKVSLEEAMDCVKDREYGGLFLRRGEQLYAIDVLPAGRANKDYGLERYPRDFMYNNEDRPDEYIDKDPELATYLFGPFAEVYGNVPIVTFTSGDVIEAVFDEPPAYYGILYIMYCEPLVPTFRVYYSAGFTNRLDNDDYVLLYDRKTGETIHLDSDGVDTLEVRDVRGELYERYAPDDTNGWTFKGLEFGETYIVSWLDVKAGELKTLEMVADSWFYGVNNVGRNYNTHASIECSRVSEDGLIISYELPELPAGSYIVSYHDTPILINVE